MSLEARFTAAKHLYRGLNTVFGLAFLALGAIALVGFQFYKDFSREAYCKREFGERWREEYRSLYQGEPLTEDPMKLFVGCAGVTAIGGLGWRISKAFTGGRRRKRRSRHRER